MKLKKSTLVLSAIVILIAGLSACNQAPAKKSTDPTTAYYRNLLFSETPWDIERGSRQLTPAEAKEINSYKFTFDNSDRIVSVEYVRGDGLLGYSSMRG